jgi:hypothetical protein
MCIRVSCCSHSFFLFYSALPLFRPYYSFTL